MDNQTWELRNRVRVETLRELATLTRAGIPLTTEALEEMAHECERGQIGLDLLALAIEPEEPVKAPRCPESQNGRQCIYDAGHDRSHFAKDADSYYVWGGQE